MNGAVICADIGTSSLKTALVDTSGAVLFYVRIRFNGTGGAERWYEAFTSAAAQAKTAARDGGCRVLGICVSGNGPTLAACTGETLLWNETPAETGATLSGDTANRSLFIPRLTLFHSTYPAAWERSPYIFSGPEYLIWRLTGEPLTILPESRYREAYWTEESLAAARLEAEKLPPFVPPAHRAGFLSAQAARQTGLPSDVPVFCGAPDFIVALIGTDTLRAGTVCDRAGSSEGINLCIAPHPASVWTPRQLAPVRILPAVIPDLYNASILIPDSGIRFSALKKETAPDASYENFVAELIARPKRYAAAYAFLTETAAEVANGVSLLFKLARDAGCPVPSRIRTTGGQAKNGAWLQFKADALGIPIEVTACPDAELIGDAVLACTGLNIFADIQEGAAALVRPHRVFEPHGAAAL